MKRTLIAALLLSSSYMACAAEYGKVLSSTPILEEVSTPQRVCRDEQVEVAPQRSADGSLIGAVAGGLLGSTVGKGSGKAAATAAGVIVGAVVGDQAVNGDARSSTQTVRRCGTLYVRSRQLVGYDVEYEYAGKRYRTRTARDPGEEIALSVAPLAALPSDTEEDFIYDDEVVPPSRERSRPAVSLHWSMGGPRHPHR